MCLERATIPTIPRYHDTNTLYATCVDWHFCTDKNSKKLEKVQERALRFVYDDYTSSYINLLEKALVPSLQIRRIRTMALETYKIVNKLAPVCLHDLVNVKNSKYAFRYSNILDVP